MRHKKEYCLFCGKVDAVVTKEKGTKVVTCPKCGFEIDRITERKK